MKKFFLYKQLDQMDCGPTCLRMVARYFGKHYSLQTLKEYAHTSREGVSMKDLSDAAVKIGFRTFGAELSVEQLFEEAPLPCILHWGRKHFVVLPPQTYRPDKKIVVADPALGMVRVSKDEFLNSWTRKGVQNGAALLLEPGAFFHEEAGEEKRAQGFAFLFRYLTPFRSYVVQLFLGMTLASGLALVIPFLTQSLVDYGINRQNMGFIYLILFSQLALFTGNTAIEMIRNWLLLHMSTRINVSIVSDFLTKLMKLPARFFDSKMVGDILQRIADHSRIEQFLTGTSLTTMFSFVNLLIFSVVMGVYSRVLLLIFFVGSALSIGWMFLFLRRRRILDYARFAKQSANQTLLFEMISGMQEIKLNAGETTQKWQWERLQAKIFKISIRSLSLAQYQDIGTNFISQLKNILVSFVAAKEVVEGHISLGMMLSVSYILGQMNMPIEQLLTFFRAAQDAKISLERLEEIHSREDEERDGQTSAPDLGDILPLSEANRVISLRNVSFQYGGAASPFILKDVTLQIPIGKVTAIVGTSGSGKTTLMKMLLKIYDPVKGGVFIGGTPLNSLSPAWWRKYCGVVMAEGYIFSGTIEQNIAMDEEVDRKRLAYAIKAANLEGFIQEISAGLMTKIGNTGNGISSGQRQRILIARAIYRQPEFLFLDEATSTLDANNERQIIENLGDFFSGRTVVVIAHRLSTVKHADQIVVLDKGEVVEVGDHAALTAQKGSYFRLVKNQLELGTS